MAEIFVGCAGWSLRRELADFFPSSGTHLERYAGRFNAVEINSSFYRPHRNSTYERWADSTSEGFQFAVKMPKQITHAKRLEDAGADLDRFASEVSGLGGKLGAVLVQLPPSLRFEGAIAGPFFEDLRTRFTAPIACEPRHPTWFTAAVDSLLTDTGVARVAADPAVVSAAARPSGSQRIAYFRWHGSPRIYYSRYDDSALTELADRLLALEELAGDVWCIFDNTAEGEATRNAVRLNELLHGQRRTPAPERP